MTPIHITTYSITLKNRDFEGIEKGLIDCPIKVTPPSPESYMWQFLICLFNRKWTRMGPHI